MKILKWNVPSELNELPEIKNRNLFAQHLSNYTPQDICQHYVYMTYDEIERFVRIVNKIGIKISGEGIELGAGCGLLTTAFLNVYNNITKIYALDIVEGLVSKIMKKIADAYIKINPENRFIPTIGSFDNIELPDYSLDFAIELDSLHHSNDLNKTLIEVSRKLKPQGILIAFDRCHPNSISQIEIDSLLNTVYSEDFIRKNHYPMGKNLTRRENGEHEYRFNEWKQAFIHAGFRSVLAFQIRPKCNSKMMMKYLFSLFLFKKSKPYYKANFKLLLIEVNYLLLTLIHLFNNKYFHEGRFKKTLFICYK
jgi:ubiquinone/menaquinone biosynthesis C-methylase UbiE